MTMMILDDSGEDRTHRNRMTGFQVPGPFVHRDKDLSSLSLHQQRAKRKSGRRIISKRISVFQGEDRGTEPHALAHISSSALSYA